MTETTVQWTITTNSSQDFQLKIVKANSYHDDLTGGMPSGRRQEMRETSKPKLFRKKKLKNGKKQMFERNSKKGKQPLPEDLLLFWKETFLPFCYPILRTAARVKIHTRGSRSKELNEKSLYKRWA